MKIWSYALGSVVLVSLISLIGVFTLSFKKPQLQKMIMLMVSFAVGALFGDAFIHLLPEAFEKLGSGLPTSLYVICGVLIFFVLEKYIRWRHCHDNPGECKIRAHRPLVWMNLIGDALHNLIDGMLIGASYVVSVPLGIATTVAVVLHEIPQEIGDFGILLRGGLSIPKALWLNFLVSLTAIAGCVFSLWIGVSVKGYTLAMLPITAGGFLYIAGSDLIPELHEELDIGTSLSQFIAILAGVGIMASLVLIG